MATIGTSSIISNRKAVDEAGQAAEQAQEQHAHDRHHQDPDHPAERPWWPG
jgi:hypothetical protein